MRTYRLRCTAAPLVALLLVFCTACASSPAPHASSEPVSRAGDVSAVAAMPRVLVFGGTGMIGGEVVRELRGRGVPVTVFVRASSNRTLLEGQGVEFVVGDVADPASIESALRARHYDVVVSSIARTEFGPPAGGVTVYASGNDHITAAARAAGVTQLIQVGTVGSGDSATLVVRVPAAHRAGRSGSSPLGPSRDRLH